MVQIQNIQIVTLYSLTFLNQLMSILGCIVFILCQNNHHSSTFIFTLQTNNKA